MQIDLSTFGDPDRPVLGLVQRTLILRTFSGFKNLSPEELALLASIGRERHFVAGEVIHEPGKPVAAFHLVVDGDIQMFRNGRPSRVFSGRSTVGGLAALARDPAGAHAVAITDVIALEIDVEDMDEVFEDNFSIIHGVMTGLAHGLREAQMHAGGGAAIDMQRRITQVDFNRELTLVDKMFIMRSATNFADVSIEALSQMARDTDELRFAAGDEVWPAGEIAEWSMLVVDGVVECLADGVAPFRFGPSFYVGGLDALTVSPRWYACRAETDVVALQIHNQRWLDVLEDHTDMALEMTRNFARGVNTLAQRQAAMAEAAAEAAEAAE